ncbi:hypothetical protein [Streptomyces huiliensis]|uniref:hypothetical protein n=1 Tax=Streptomyces huiliensis TaxID=2876027 RepID=UPI001CBEDF9A|nr:hypothetical protein [Streptomyces huiliensis]MBZ4319022.1 hypothetical protein [Streptomyces huiliensis]
MYQHAQQKQRNWFARHKVLTAAGALVVVVGAGAALSGGDDGDSASGKVVTADGRGTAGKDSGAKKEGKKADISGSGTFQVGSDVKPGTYRSVGNKESGNCYWERAKGSKGDPDSIIANDNVTGSSYVTIKADDKIFKSQGCKGWERVPAKADGAPRTTSVSGDGMYRIGADIAPGTYRSTGNKADGNCYWERAKDALHGMESIAANENVTGNGIVTITPQDAYFKTSGCADWKKTG